MKRIKWDKRRSPVGWYLATYIERFAVVGEGKVNPRKRCRAWENSVLIRARTPAEAYQRALKQATLCSDTPWHNEHGVEMRLVFEGFTGLLPIYDELEHGAEISWTDHRNVTVSTIRRRIQPKEKLQVFSKD